MIRKLVRTAVSGGAAVGITGVLSPVVSALSFVGEEAMDPVLWLWGSSILKATGVEVRAQGLERLPPGNFVLAVNHQSNFDALVLFSQIRRHFRYVAKAELRKIPVFGYALHRAGNIFVDRSGSGSDRAILNEAVKAVQHRVSVVFFAEGTRSDDGVLRPFRRGAAVMALEAQVPLVPAALAGTHRILQKGSKAITPHPAALVIGEPMETKGHSVDERDDFTERAHAEVAKRLVEAEALVRDMGGTP